MFGSAILLSIQAFSQGQIPFWPCGPQETVYILLRRCIVDFLDHEKYFSKKFGLVGRVQKKIIRLQNAVGRIKKNISLFQNRVGRTG